MWQEILSELVTGLLVPIISLVITAIAIPALIRWFKKIGIELSIVEEQKISQTLDGFVRSAEVVFKGEGKGKEKFTWVMQNGVKELTRAGVDVARYNIESKIEATHSKIFGTITPKMAEK